MEIVNSQNSSGIIEWPDRKLKIVNITHLVPFVSFFCIDLVAFNYLVLLY